MRLFTLNIRQGGGTRTGRLLEWLALIELDIAVLTEFRRGDSGDQIARGLGSQGLRYLASPESPPGLNSSLIASRFPLKERVIETSPSDSHRVVSVEVEGIELAGVYFAQKNEKQTLYQALGAASGGLLKGQSLIMGDFNTGIRGVDETGESFYAEECFISLLDQGWIDSWRSRHPTKTEFSWYSRKGSGFRIDHALASPTLDERISSARYEHSVREAGLSDHSALVVEVAG